MVELIYLLVVLTYRIYLPLIQSDITKYINIYFRILTCLIPYLYIFLFKYAIYFHLQELSNITYQVPISKGTKIWTQSSKYNNK